MPGYKDALTDVYQTCRAAVDANVREDVATSISQAYWLCKMKVEITDDLYLVYASNNLVVQIDRTDQRGGYGGKSIQLNQDNWVPYHDFGGDFKAIVDKVWDVVLGHGQHNWVRLPDPDAFQYAIDELNAALAILAMPEAGFDTSTIINQNITHVANILNRSEYSNGSAGGTGKPMTGAMVEAVRAMVTGELSPGASELPSTGDRLNPSPGLPTLLRCVFDLVAALRARLIYEQSLWAPTRKDVARILADAPRPFNEWRPGSSFNVTLWTSLLGVADAFTAVAAFINPPVGMFFGIVDGIAEIAISLANNESLSNDPNEGRSVEELITALDKALNGGMSDLDFGSSVSAGLRIRETGLVTDLNTMATHAIAHRTRTGIDFTLNKDIVLAAKCNTADQNFDPKGVKAIAKTYIPVIIGELKEAIVHIKNAKDTNAAQAWHRDPGLGYGDDSMGAFGAFTGFLDNILNLLDGSGSANNVLLYTAGVFSNYADGIINVDADTCAAFSTLSDKLPYVG